MKMRRGEVSSALQEVELCLQRFPYETSEGHWRCRVLKAEFLHQQGFEKEALTLVQPEPPALLATSDPAVRRKLLQGIASTFMQNFSEADAFLEQGEKLIRVNHPELAGELALRRGTYYFFRDEMDLAGASYLKTLHLAREQKDRFLEVGALNGLGVVATSQEHYDESIDWNRSGLQLSQSLGARSSLVLALGNTGWSYAELGDFENALIFYKQAEQTSAESKRIGSQTYWLTSIAYVYHLQQNYEAAGVILEQALDLARTLDNKGTLAQCLTQLSEIALESGSVDQAEKYNNEASDLKRSGLDQRLVLDTVVLRGRIALKKRQYSEAESFFHEVMRDPKVATAQRWGAQARLATVYANEKLIAKADGEFRQVLETIENARASIQTEGLRLSFLSTATGFYNDYIEFLISQKRPADALQVAELSRARTLAEGLGTAPKALTFPLRDFHPQETARRSNATLLFYWLGRTDSYLWVITPEKTSLLTLPKDAEIEPLVKSYRQALPDVDDAEDANASDGRKLFTMLVEPAKELIRSGSRVILLPAESLYGLNFETLIVPEPKPHFWIEDVTLATASSLTLLDASIQRPAIIGQDLLLVGNTVPVPGFPVLAQAPAEMRNVGHYFPEENRKVLESRQATATAYLGSKPERFAYLHFVTHGTASRTRPLESAVILSPEGDSYKLYARDVVTRHLNAQLVTISACNTSGNRTISGEGLVGLSWAFLRAGAHNVIGALWEVSDASTPQLMDALYAGVIIGQDPAAALRSAKLSLLHSANPDSVFKKPFYWAPFQLYVGS
jgi:CHAT domain-containing protein